MIIPFREIYTFISAQLQLFIVLLNELTVVKGRYSSNYRLDFEWTNEFISVSITLAPNQHKLLTIFTYARTMLKARARVEPEEALGKINESL